MLLNRLTKKAQMILQTASQNARGNKVTIGSVIDAIHKSSGVAGKLLKKLSKIEIDRSKSVNLNRLVEEAFYQSAKFNHAYVGTEHLLLAALHISSSPQAEAVKTEVLKLNTFPHNVKPIDVSRYTPILDTFGFNLVEKKADYIVHRDEIDQVISILLQRKSPNPLLVGDLGVGKDSIVRLLASKIATLDVPISLVGYKILEFDLLSFIASLSSKEGIEYGLTSLLEEFAHADRIIIYIKNFQNLFATASGGLTVPLAFSMFKSDMALANVRLIAAMNNPLFDRIASENEHVLDDFSVVEVDEPGEKKTLEVLQSALASFEKFHGVKVPKEVVSYVYTKANGQSLDTKFPQKGLDLLDKACARLLLKNSAVPKKFKTLSGKKERALRGVKSALEKGNVAKAVRLREGVKDMGRSMTLLEGQILGGKALTLQLKDVDDAMSFMGLGDAAKQSDLAELAGKIKAAIVGQDEAVDVVVKGLIRSRLGLRSKKRPLGNFLFLGPTGVGKTELAKVLAKQAFGESRLIRLDMSDFGEKHTVARLIGAPPGYVGYGEGGDLTGRIESNPDSVVLFDEIEKAHSDVLNILLQVMEEGELSDARGNIFDFSRAVVILTSNLGTGIIQKGEIGFTDGAKSSSKVEKRLRENLKKILKPELLNRFDEIIVFKKLEKPAQMRILDLILDEVKQSLGDQSVDLSVGKKVKAWLLERGYSDEYGARALRRVIESQLLDRIAEMLLKETDRPLRMRAKVSGDKIELDPSLRSG